MWYLTKVELDAIIKNCLSDWQVGLINSKPFSIVLACSVVMHPLATNTNTVIFRFEFDWNLFYNTHK